MRRILMAVAATAAMSTALAACGADGSARGAGGDPSTPSSAQGETGTSGPLAWTTCKDIRRPGEQSPARPDSTFQCAKLKVPLDYAKPGAESLEIALIRVKATGPGQRIGSLVFNFGGPGASGVDTLAQAAKVFSTLNTRYDLVSFDPRGVERSSGIRCDGKEVMDRYTAMNSYASDEAEWATLEKTVDEFVNACQASSGKLLPYVGTVNAAQDMDRIREALGDQKLNYFGISYGTQLGAVYATKFPQNVGRFVLDAPLDPDISMRERTLVQSAGFQQAYDSFLKDCVEGPGGCEIGSDATVANKNVDKFIVDLKAKPLSVNGRQLTEGLANTGMAAALYSKLTWPLLEQGLSQAFKGDGRLLMALSDSYNGRMPNGSYNTLMSSFPAISCADTSERPTRDQVMQTQTEALKASPLFGSPGMGLICRVWPAPGSDEAKKVNAAGSAPIVVIGGTGDPATPYKWAPKLTAELKTGVLVTYKGEGHGAYLAGNPCVKKTTDGYLLDGKVPATDTTCTAS
ncbi:alpha/beta hydrolase [Streptosporangium sp. NPDC000396]|uniref:alpha/beta hydrolase n=1 Tax=Streptosporangium sp. NPDC000396 TaxID=3366185 RepID=UPI0036BFF616